tara:strand:- start:1432 stop:2232 length:801 start_codon:yes stop_codon:yes gene_type:complete
MKNIFSLLIIFCLISCSDNEDQSQTEDANTSESLNNNTSTNNSSSSTLNDISILADKFYYEGKVSVVVNEDNLVITASDLPDHKSAYYNINNSLYESYDEPNNPSFNLNPNNITEQNIVMTIPRFPEVSNLHEATPMGPMGVAVNSVAIYNQMAAPGDDILEELNTFDQYEGHPAPGGVYHYHIEPIWLTQTLGDDAFLGFLLDGFPVYGPVEDGKRITNDDLDDYHGHIHNKSEFPEGIYHYHVTDDLPWINGDGFYGNAGTITR